MTQSTLAWVLLERDGCVGECNGREKREHSYQARYCEQAVGSCTIAPEKRGLHGILLDALLGGSGLQLLDTLSDQAKQEDGQ
jgi:hypothetical protein